MRRQRVAISTAAADVDLLLAFAQRNDIVSAETLRHGVLAAGYELDHLDAVADILGETYIFWI